MRDRATLAQVLEVVQSGIGLHPAAYRPHDPDETGGARVPGGLGAFVR